MSLMELTIDDYINRFKLWTKEDMAKYCKGKIKHYKQDAVHEINKYLLFKTKTWDVINTQNLTIICFKTEEEALDFCLDRFKDSKPPKQLSF